MNYRTSYKITGSDRTLYLCVREERTKLRLLALNGTAAGPWRRTPHNERLQYSVVWGQRAQRGQTLLTYAATGWGRLKRVRRARLHNARTPFEPMGAARDAETLTRPHYLLQGSLHLLDERDGP